MNTTLILIGVGCIIGAIVGGGVKLVQIELSPLASLWRQMILGAFGLVLVLAGVAVGAQGPSPLLESGPRPVITSSPSASLSPSPSSSPNAGPGISGSGTAAGDYVIPASGERPLVAADLQGLSSAQLRLARNEIYARHGRTFQSADLVRHFTAKGWYHPVGSGTGISPMEQANVDLIQSAEKSAPH